MKNLSLYPANILEITLEKNKPTLTSFNLRSNIKQANKALIYKVKVTNPDLFIV